MTETPVPPSIPTSANASGPTPTPPRPDLVGMGDPGLALNGHYRFVDHAHCLDAWFDALGWRL